MEPSPLELSAQTGEHLREIGVRLARAMTTGPEAEYYFVPSGPAIALGQAAVLEVLKEAGPQKEESVQDIILECWQEHPDIGLTKRRQEFIKAQRDILERGVKFLQMGGVVIPNARHISFNQHRLNYDPIKEYENKTGSKIS